jgi:DNA polymerase III alpha subunit (gram-positive type)
MSANIIPDEFSAVRPTLEIITAQAGSLRIVSPEAYEDAGALLKTIKGALRQIEAQRTSITAPMNEALRNANAQAKIAAAPFEAAEKRIKGAMISYADEQERLRQAEQRKAEELARREREKLEAQAAKAAASGKVDKAEQLEERAAAVVAPVINREPPKVAGVSTREVWKFEVTDPSLVPRQYLEVDEAKIRRVVQAMKADANIPGVRVWAERQLAAGAA